MKKSLLALLLALGVSQATAGEKFAAGLAFNGGVALAGQYQGDIGTINAQLGLGGLSIDYLLLQGAIADVKGLSYYVGGGASIGMVVNSFYASLRIPLGIDYDINEQVDVFVEYVPGLSLSPLGLSFSGYTAGVRYFF